jgi:curved DNA-binding protein CbpA
MRKLFENWRGFITERARYVSDINQAYGILGLQPNASMSAAKTAFRKLAMKVHPDMNPDDPEASREFQKAREAWDAIQNPGSFKFAPAGAPSGGGEAGPTSGPEAVKGMWDSATQRDPSAKIILASLMTIKSQAEEAIRGGESIKRQGVSLPAEIVISNPDFNNLNDFMKNYQWEYIRNIMGGEQFVKDKILRTLRDVPYSTKFGSGKQDLQTFVDVLSRVLPPPSEEKQEEPAKKRKPGEWQDASSMSSEEEAKFKEQFPWL